MKKYNKSFEEHIDFTVSTECILDTIDVSVVVRYEPEQKGNLETEPLEENFDIMDIEFPKQCLTEVKCRDIYFDKNIREKAIRLFKSKYF